MLAQACSHVARGLSGCRVGSLDDGGACIIVSLRAPPGDEKSSVRWLIWRDRGRLLSRSCGTQGLPVEHASMLGALQSIAGLSEAEASSAASLADAMLLFQSEADLAANLAMAA